MHNDAGERHRQSCLQLPPSERGSTAVSLRLCVDLPFGEMDGEARLLLARPLRTR